MSYEKELAAAKKAVSLAARLSQVTTIFLINHGTILAWSLYEPLKLNKPYNVMNQEVQKTLLQSQVWTKIDRSPVTAADYGLYLVICIPANSNTSFGFARFWFSLESIKKMSLLLSFMDDFFRLTSCG